MTASRKKISVPMCFISQRSRKICTWVMWPNRLPMDQRRVPMRKRGKSDHQPHHDAGDNGDQGLPPQADGEEAEKKIAGGVPVPIVVAEEEDEEEEERQHCGNCGAFAIHDW